MTLFQYIWPVKKEYLLRKPHKTLFFRKYNECTYCVEYARIPLSFDPYIPYKDKMFDSVLIPEWTVNENPFSGIFYWMCPSIIMCLSGNKYLNQHFARKIRFSLDFWRKLKPKLQLNPKTIFSWFGFCEFFCPLSIHVQYFNSSIVCGKKLWM